MDEGYLDENTVFNAELRSGDFNEEGIPVICSVKYVFRRKRRKGTGHIHHAIRTAVLQLLHTLP